MFHMARIFQIVVLLLMASGAFADEIPPTHVLAWDAEQLSPGWIPGAENALPVGPSAFDFNDEMIVVADVAHRRILILDRRFEPRDAFHVDEIPADLRIDSQGNIVALSSDLDRIVIYGNKGALVRALDIEQGRVRSLAKGPKGRIWWEDRHGHCHALEGKEPKGLALPQGPGAFWHGTGRQIDKRNGEVLLWKWGKAAEVKPPGPARSLSVETHSSLGSIRPLGIDRKGRILVRVESLSAKAPLVVTTHVLAYGPSDSLLGRLSWIEAGISPVSWNIRMSVDGTLMRMEAREEGLVFWKEEAEEWMTGGAR